MEQHTHCLSFSSQISQPPDYIITKKKNVCVTCVLELPAKTKDQSQERILSSLPGPWDTVSVATVLKFVLEEWPSKK